MFETFFEMERTPFARDIPPESLYEPPFLADTLGRLSYAADRQLFAVVTGDAGCGKSTLVRKFASTLSPKDYIVMYLSDSKLTPRWFYKGMLDQLGIEARFYRGDAKRQLQKEVEIIRGVQKKKAVCILDEAHLLEKETIEEFRFMLNYRFDSESPMALILVGQTELWDKLKLQAFRSVRNRIEITCFLGPLDFSQTKSYIERQLDYSGHTGAIFTDEAMQKVYAFSSGVPRLINRACTQSLNYAYQNRKALVDDRMVELILEEEIA